MKFNKLNLKKKEIFFWKTFFGEQKNYFKIKTYNGSEIF